MPGPIQIRGNLRWRYNDVYTPEALAALGALAHFNKDQTALMKARIERRDRRFQGRERIGFLPLETPIPGTRITVKDARAGKFLGSEIPADLQRQWIQGTGPAAKPNARVESSIRNIAYALLSGADGWMFDGEDALGQITTMSLENQRNLRLAIHRDPVFLGVAEQVADEMNTWARKFHGRAMIDDWRAQLDFTTKLFRARGLHLADRHIRDADGRPFSASIADAALYVANNHRRLQADGSSIVLYLPKIQTMQEAALWNAMLGALEGHVGLRAGAIKTYVLVEQLEATYQLMEIRAALGQRFVGYNTGRWDYINSVADAMAWDPEFINPNIESIVMTYGYMRNYEDRVRRAVNTPDLEGRFALWQGGMEPNIPVGTAQGVADSMRKAVDGAEREQREGASGKWVAHWKMVHIVRPVWERAGQTNQLGRTFPPLSYTPEDADGLVLLEPAPRTIRGARNLLSVGLQYGNAFGQGLQAAALKPADFFTDDNILYLMEDMATGEIRLSILWEWIHKGATLTEDDPPLRLKAGATFGPEIFDRLLDEEYTKLRQARDKDVHDNSKNTTLPIAREIVKTYVLDELKYPWYIDLLNINLNNQDLSEARDRIRLFAETFKKDGTRIVENLDTAAGRKVEDEGKALLKETAETERWMSRPRFEGLTRLYSARQVVEQRGSIVQDYTVAREMAEAFHARLRELHTVGKSITTFGPYSPGQAVVMKRVGIEGIYLGGWATSAKGSINEDPGADLASYPLSQVPDEAAPVVRALLTADRNQSFLRSRMSEQQREATPRIDYRPFIVADADTGHGGDAHVRNLVRRFVEIGVTGYHIEDQKPGVKKCGHQGGKVLVPVDEQIKRLNAARFQLDVMKVAGLVVARTDAEAATLLDSNGDERDHAFVLGVTNVNIPSWKSTFLAVLRKLNELGASELNGHRAYRLSEGTYRAAYAWLDRVGLFAAMEQLLGGRKSDAEVPEILNTITDRFVEQWEAEAGLKTFGQAVADAMAFHIDEGQEFDLSIEQWSEWARGASLLEARTRARAMGVNVVWDPELSRTPEGYYPIRGGIEYAIARSLAVAPFADIIWMETKTANLPYARRFAQAIHAAFPDKMLAYNLSPSFNWDTTGMSEEEMREFPTELGKLGYVFNFITYGGHQVDGMASEEFATALKQEGMLALARLQRKLRLVDSPYRTPQTLVGGPRLDAALSASSGRTATTKAMGKGSTQVQHLVQTEVPPRLLEEWLALWSTEHGIAGPLSVKLRPFRAGSELLSLNILDAVDNKVAHVVFATIQDRHGRNILSIRDQETFDTAMRQKRLMILAHLFLFHRYKIVDVHYVTPTADNEKQAAGMQRLELYSSVATEVGQIIVAAINAERVAALLGADRAELSRLITKK